MRECVRNRDESQVESICHVIPSIVTNREVKIENNY